MFKVFLTLLITAFIAGANAQDLTINTPTGVIQCQPQLLAWSGGTAPYFLSLLPGNQPSANPLMDFGKQNGTSLTWTVNYPSGTSLGLTLRDSTGKVAQSAAFTVGTSSDSSCLTSSASGSTKTGTGTTSTTTATGVTTTKTGVTTSTSTTKPPTTNTGGGGTSTTTGPSPSGTSTKASSANKLIADSAMVGAIGMAIFVLLA